jgi:transcriptional regulator with XRE-family HTH domain
MTNTSTPAQRVIDMTGEERKSAREALKKSQQKVAQEVGASIGAVRHWELGVEPQAHRLDAYAAALGLAGGAR